MSEFNQVQTTHELNENHFQKALQAGASEDFVIMARNDRDSAAAYDLLRHVTEWNLTHDSNTRNFNFIGSPFTEALWYEGAACAGYYAGDIHGDTLYDLFRVETWV